MKESDWKVFKQIKEKAIEVFCNNVLSECGEIIKNTDYDPHDAYLRLYKTVTNKDKKMASLFDGHSRSKASLQLMVIRREGLADEALLKKLSAEFLQQTDPPRMDW